MSTKESKPGKAGAVELIGAELEKVQGGIYSMDAASEGAGFRWKPGRQGLLGSSGSKWLD